jgi:hypothetical protein
LRTAPADHDHDFLPSLGVDVRQARHLFAFPPSITHPLKHALASLALLDARKGKKRSTTPRKSLPQDATLSSKNRWTSY